MNRSNYHLYVSHEVYDAIHYHARRAGIPVSHFTDGLLQQALKFDQMTDAAEQTSRRGRPRKSARLPSLGELPFLTHYGRQPSVTGGRRR